MLCQLRQQRETGHGDEKTVASGAFSEAESASQGVSLGLRQRLDQMESRPDELMKPGERKVGFRFDAARPQNPQVGGLRTGILEQSRLAHAGLAAHDQRAAP